MQSGVGGIQLQQPGSGNPSPQHQMYAGSSGQQQQPGLPGVGAYAAATHGQSQASGMYGQQPSSPSSGPVSDERHDTVVIVKIVFLLDRICIVIK